MASRKQWTIKLVGWTPTSLNQYSRNKGVRIRVGKQIDKLLEPWVAETSPGRIPEATGRRHVDVRVDYAAGQRACDPDNLVKPLFDGLKRGGIIRGDSDKWLDYDKPTIGRALFPTTTITVTEMPSADDPIYTDGGAELVALSEGDRVSIQTVGGFGFSVSLEDIPPLIAKLRDARNQAKRNQAKPEKGLK